jgi:NAD(P)-dependent dehydrogenase (short-subunit alcohol dehydrogenase family)
VTGLHGKVAVVTGAAHERGIGRGIALALAEHGCDVVIADIGFEPMANELVEQLRGMGRRAAFHCVDVSDRPQVDDMMEDVEKEFGPPWIVCSNAGVADWEPWHGLTGACFDRVVGVNLTGAFNMGQASARAMVARGDGGRIIFTSSAQVQLPNPTMAVYGATKQGVRALCELMAVELGGHGITVNHVGPGWVKSQINDSSPALQTMDDETAMTALIPLGRPGVPADVGHAVTYLCSEGAAYLTGVYIRVDGGIGVGKY